MTKIRWAGLGLIGLGILVAVLFVYFANQQGPDGYMGRTRVNALVFVPLAIVAGLAFLIGDMRVLEAFQARPKSKGQLAFVLSIIIGSGVLTGLMYWKVRSQWHPAEPVILDASPKRPPEFPIPTPPTLPNVQPPAR